MTGNRLPGYDLTGHAIRYFRPDTLPQTLTRLAVWASTPGLYVDSVTVNPAGNDPGWWPLWDATALYVLDEPDAP